MAEFSDEIIEIISKKDKTIQTAEQKLFNKLTPTNQRIFGAVKKLIDKMNTSGGKIDFDDKNIDLVSMIDKTIIDAIQGSDMPSAISEYLRNFETIKQFNFDVQKDVNELSVDELEDLISPVQKQAVESTLEGLTGSGVNTNFIEPVRQGLFQNIVAGTSKSELEQYLTNYILGNPNVDGLYSRYVKQVSRDALNQFEGQINSRIAEEFELDAFRYVGSLIEDSRSQCVRWVKKRILQKSDLDSEISWATNNGSGMISGTNKENFATFRGGYNCRHSAIPFKLTPSQKKRLEEDQIDDENETETKVEDQISEVKKKVKTNKKKQENVSNQEQLNEEFFVSSQTPEFNKKFFEIVADADSAAKFSNSGSVPIGLLTPSEAAAPLKSKNLFINKPKVFASNVPRLTDGTGGMCTYYASSGKTAGLSVKTYKNDTILKKNYSNQLNSLYEDRERFLKENDSLYLNAKGDIIRNGYKFTEGDKIYGIFSMSELKDNNIAPTITHEFAHLIHNNVDPKKRDILTSFARQRQIRLTDAPTSYGETNWSEFWTESFSAYVYAPEWFEKYHKKTFDFFKDLVKEYKIDIDTIIQYK